MVETFLRKSKELKKRIKSENKARFEKFMIKELKESYESNVGAKLRQESYQNFVDYERDLLYLQNWFSKSFMNGAKKGQILNEFLLQKSIAGHQEILRQ